MQDSGAHEDVHDGEVTKQDLRSSSGFELLRLGK